MAERTEYPFDLESLQAAEHLPASKFSLKSQNCILGIGLTSRCNFNCPFCYYHRDASKSSPTVMPLELLRQILEGLKPLKAVNFALEGEPLCYPHFFDAMDIAADCAKEIMLCSNGSLLTEKVQARLLQYPLSMLTLSIDGSDEDSYTFMHRGTSLERFKRHASLAVDNFGNKVFFSSLICQQNLQSLLGLPRLAAELGVKSISLTALRSHAGALAQGITEATPQEQIQCLEALLTEAEQAQVLLFFDSYSRHEQVRSWIEAHHIKDPADDIFQAGCPMPWFYTSILSSGKLFPCCGDFKPEPVEGFTLEQVFGHTYLQRLRALIAAQKYPEACNYCGHGIIRLTHKNPTCADGI